MAITTLTTYDPNDFQDNSSLVEQAWGYILRSVPTGTPSDRLMEIQSGQLTLQWRSLEEANEFIAFSDSCGDIVKTVLTESE